MVCKIDDRVFFDHDLEYAINQQIERVNRDYASAIIIDGGVGKGKTCAAVQIADYISIKQGQGLINLNMQLARGFEEFFSKLDDCIRSKRSILIYDEAGDFSKKATLTRINMLLNRVFEQYRQFHIIIILCLPLADNLDNSILHNEIPRMLLHIESRSNTKIHGKVFSLRKFFLIKKTMLKIAQKSLAYRSYAANFHFNVYRLPAEREAEVKKLSLAGKKENVKNAIIVSQGLISYVDISKKVHKSVIWVKKQLLALKVKPVKIIDRRKYFNSEEVLELLQDIGT